jgi:hypothetical protein
MNLSLYHKFLDISIIPAGLNPIEANNPSKHAEWQSNEGANHSYIRNC